MAEVSIRDLRNHGGDVVDRVQGGEHITVTRAGKPVAQLRPLAPVPISAAALLAGARSLPPVDPIALRADIDAVLDARL